MAPITESTGRQELRPHLRDERTPDDSILVVRGGSTTLAKLGAHLQRTHEAYVLDGQPFWGVSVFGALDDIGPASLDALLQRFESYPVIHLPTVGQIRRAAFELLPSFGRPHFTVRAMSDHPAVIERLLDALGTAERNPYNRRGPGGSTS